MEVSGGSLLQGYKFTYRVTRSFTDLGWVILDLACSTILPGHEVDTVTGPTSQGRNYPNLSETTGQPKPTCIWFTLYHNGKCTTRRQCVSQFAQFSPCEP